MYDKMKVTLGISEYQALWLAFFKGAIVGAFVVYFVF